MKNILILILTSLTGIVTASAQDTVYVSNHKVTALFFNAPVEVISNPDEGIVINQKAPDILTIKASSPTFSLKGIELRGRNNQQLYHIPVVYSYGRAGRTYRITDPKPITTKTVKKDNPWQKLLNDLTNGKRHRVADHQKVSKVKAWADQLSVADNRILLRVDLRNRSNLPYQMDFIRFYIRDRKSVARTATHEAEIVPFIQTLKKEEEVILPDQETALAFGFPRFSLNEGQDLNIQIYERNGNRNLYLKISEKDIEQAPTMSLPTTPTL